MATPIWKDVDVALGTGDSADFIIYDKADNTGNIIYQGKSFKRPGQTYCSAKVNDILADYLKQQLVADVVNIRQPFSVYVGTSRKLQGEFFLCWDYETASDDLDGFPNRPITGRIQVGTPIPITKYANYSQEVLASYSPYATGARISIGTTAEVRNFLHTCQSGYNSVALFPRYSLTDHTELGFSLTIIPKCHRWQLYYQNLLGGIDCLVIEGKTVQRDKFGRVVISKAYNNANITPIHRAGKEVVSTDVTRTWELHTGWLTDAEAGRMGHLLGSPLVYLYDCVSGVYYPVIIKTDEYQQKVTRYDGMIQYTINVELAETMKR
jgi:hypothetical protein